MAQGRCNDPAKEQARRAKNASSRRGKKHSDETREKMGLSQVTAQGLRRAREDDERLDGFIAYLDRPIRDRRGRRESLVAAIS